jgi:predicted acyltransferase
MNMGTNAASTADVNKPRVLSLDALRGFDMFWIIGGGTLFQILSRCIPGSFFQAIANQMEHVPWEGFHFEDLIFPLFMFISGATIPIAILSKLESGTPKKDLIWKTARRMILLVILGIIFNGTLRSGFANARYASVLGQIGISYFIASMILIHSHSLKTRLFWLIGILAGYAVVQLCVPVPGYGAGDLTPAGCINSFIDRNFLPGRMGQGTFDALGLMCIVSASAVTLMGSIAGHFLLRREIGTWRMLGILASIGTALIILALVLNPFYPVIKNCWTSTFNLLTGGISFLLMALFYLIIDVWGLRKWSFFFRVIGMNSVFIYLIVVGNLVDISHTSMFFLGWIVNLLSENAGQLVLVIGNFSFSWLLLYLMYRKKIFIKV